MVLSSWEGVLEAVRRGAGLAIAWHAVVWRELQRGTLRRVTVEGYRDELFQKLGVNTRTGLVIYALKNGMVNL